MQCLHHGFKFAVPYYLNSIEFPLHIPPCTTLVVAFFLQYLFHNHLNSVNMQNEKGQNVELYMPRRWYGIIEKVSFIAIGLTELLMLKITLLLWYLFYASLLVCRLTLLVLTLRLVLLLVNMILSPSVVTFVLRYRLLICCNIVGWSW